MNSSDPDGFVPVFSSLAGKTRLRLLLTLKEKALINDSYNSGVAIYPNGVVM